MQHHPQTPPHLPDGRDWPQDQELERPSPAFHFGRWDGRRMRRAYDVSRGRDPQQSRVPAPTTATGIADDTTTIRP